MKIRVIIFFAAIFFQNFIFINYINAQSSVKPLSSFEDFMRNKGRDSLGQLQPGKIMYGPGFNAINPYNGLEDLHQLKKPSWFVISGTYLSDEARCQDILKNAKTIIRNGQEIPNPAIIKYGCQGSITKKSNCQKQALRVVNAHSGCFTVTRRISNKQRYCNLLQLSRRKDSSQLAKCKQDLKDLLNTNNRCIQIGIDEYNKCFNV